MLGRLSVALGLGLMVLLGLGSCTSTPSVDATHNLDGSTATVDAFDLLRAAADHEALFALAGGLKPMSTGIWQGTFAVDEPDLAELRAVRAALAPLRNDLWHADVQVFNAMHDGRRSVHAFVIHRRAMVRMIERFEWFWSPWGITTCTHPSEVIAVVDRMPKADRWRGYGYLFGYPADAVDFFVAAGLAAEDDRAIGPGVDRQFLHIPTHAADSGRFTYAVPVDHVRTPGDDALAHEASRILAAYAGRRERLTTTRAMLAELRRLDRRFAPTAIAAAAVRDARHAAEGVADAVLDTR